MSLLFCFRLGLLPLAATQLSSWDFPSSLLGFPLALSYVLHPYFYFSYLHSLVPHFGRASILLVCWEKVRCRQIFWCLCVWTCFYFHHTWLTFWKWIRNHFFLQNFKGIAPLSFRFPVLLLRSQELFWVLIIFVWPSFSSLKAFRISNRSQCLKWHNDMSLVWVNFYPLCWVLTERFQSPLSVLGNFSKLCHWCFSPSVSSALSGAFITRIEFLAWCYFSISLYFCSAF